MATVTGANAWACDGRRAVEIISDLAPGETPALAGDHQGGRGFPICQRWVMREGQVPRRRLCRRY